MVVATKTKRKRKVVLGPEDNGRRMSLDDFDRAVVREGFFYELNKGAVEVSDIPKIRHGKIVRAVRTVLTLYEAEHPDVVKYSGGGSEAKILIAPEESERHPDWLIYLREPPTDDQQPWPEWVPEIVIEVVSESSVKRDYEDKPPEYATAGVLEYWIVDPSNNTVTINTRWRSAWKPRVLKPGQSHETKLLPGFKLDVRKILAAGK